MQQGNCYLPEENSAYLSPSSSYSPGRGLLDTYLKEIGKPECNPLPKKEQLELGWMSKGGDEKAKEELIERNLRFVVWVAKKYNGNSGYLDLLDLIGEGNLALIYSADRFDPSRNFKLAALAGRIIKNYINSLLLEEKSLVVKRGIQQNVNYIEKVLKEQDDEVIDMEWLSEKTGMTEKKIESALKAKRCCVSSIDDTDNRGSLERECIDPDIMPDMSVDFEKMKSDVRGLLNEVTEKGVLTDRESYILNNRFCDDPVPFKKLAKKYNITRQRAQKVLAKTIRDIRKYLDENPEKKSALMEHYEDLIL